MKQSIAGSFVYKAAETIGDQLVTFVISLVLARLLGPSRYGSMTLMLIAVALAEVIVRNGFQTALIQKKETDRLDFSSVFYAGLLMAALLYLLIFLIAPELARLFADPEITPMLRTLSVILFFGSVISVETAIVSREMDFKSQFISTLAADALAGTAGIIAALKGAGTWALVLQQIIKYAVLMLILWVRLGFNPGRGFSLYRLRILFSFGWKVLVSGLIDTIFTNLYTPVISRLYTSRMTGLYGRANQFPQVITNSAAQCLQAVMLPALSRIQDEKEQFRMLMQRAVRISSLVLFPLMFGMMAVSDVLILVLLGEEWMEASGMLSACCLAFSVWQIHVINLQALNAAGRSDIYLKLEIIKKAAGTAVLVFSVPYGISVMLFARAAFDYLCTFINAAPNKKLAGYGPAEQWKDVLPEFLMASTMALTVRFAVPCLLPGGSPKLLLLLQIAAGVLYYTAAALIFRPKSVVWLKETAEELMRKRAGHR